MGRPDCKRNKRFEKKYASKFKNDPDALFEDILKRQEISKRKRFSFSARKPKSKKNVA